MPNLNRSYSWAINTCNAPDVGYSQTYRNQQTIGGITYYDCSSFIWYALLAGGFDCVTANGGSSWPFTTYNMGAVLQRLEFNELYSAQEQWLPGDIMVSSGHTEMTYTGGMYTGITMGAHSANRPLADQVSINTYTSTSSQFPLLYRYKDGGATGYGYSIYVVAALCGNSWRESTINPGITEVGGGGYGLFQWTGDRRTKLEAWLTDNGYALDDAEGQLEYLIVENDWIDNYGGFASLQDFLQTTSTDIPFLTEVFMRCWERPGVPELGERVERAEQCYQYILNFANSTTIYNWYSSTGYLSKSQSLNNAVMMYRYYSAGGGGGGTIGKRKRKMLVWMYIKYHY